MTASPTEAERGVESQLIDLSHVSLRQLRVRDDVTLTNAMRHVVEQVAQMGVNLGDSDGGGQRID